MVKTPHQLGEIRRRLRSLILGKDLKHKEHDSKYYDHSFEKSKQYHLHYTYSDYYPVWTVVLDRIKRTGLSNIIDIGCGAGQFACLLRDNNISNYIGVDLSPARIDHARRICPEYRFLAEDVFASDLLKTQDYDSVFALEFLEHIKRDIEFISMISPGTTCIFSVPNFGGRTHVRYFKTIQQVSQRYERYFKTVTINEILLNSRGKRIFILQGNKA